MSKETKEAENIEEALNNIVEENTQETEETTENAEQQEETKDPLTVAQEEVEELKKQLLYKVAEFDNYRKRTMKEKAELILNGGEKTITAILPVIDDMERALDNMKKAENIEAVIEGVELIHKKFIGILEKQGVKAIETAEAEFDTDLHEAIAQIPAPAEELKGKIIDCTLKGYKLNEKVIRHSQVVVGL